MCWGAVFGFVGYTAYVAVTHQKWDPTQAVIATVAGAATGGVSAIIGPMGFAGASAVLVRGLSGALIGQLAATASLDARILRGERLTRKDYAQLPAAMLSGAITGQVPLRDPDLANGAGSFAVGLGLGGLNAVVGNALDDVTKGWFDGSDGTAPAPAK